MVNSHQCPHQDTEQKEFFVSRRALVAAVVSRNQAQKAKILAEKMSLQNLGKQHARHTRENGMSLSPIHGQSGLLSAKPTLNSSMQALKLLLLKKWHMLSLFPRFPGKKGMHLPGKGQSG